MGTSVYSKKGFREDNYIYIRELAKLCNSRQIVLSLSLPPCGFSKNVSSKESVKT